MMVFALTRVFSNGESAIYSVHVDAVGAMADAEKIDAIRFESTPEFGVKEWRTLGTLGLHFTGISGERRTTWRVQGYEVKE